MTTEKREFYGGEIKIENTVNDPASDMVVIHYHDISIVVSRYHHDKSVRCDVFLNTPEGHHGEEITSFDLGTFGYNVRIVDHG